MRKSKVLITICALGAVAAMTLSTASLAANDNEISINKGIYVGASIGYGGSGNNPYTHNSRALGLIYGFNGGYKFNKYFALEGGYTALPNVTIGNSDLTKDNWLVDVAAKGIIPINQRFNIYGKVGIARVSTKYNAIEALDSNQPNGVKHRFTPLYGAGAGINISRHTAFTLEYEMTPKSGPVPATQSFLVGFQFKI